jgi:hypothetical protein
MDAVHSRLGVLLLVAFGTVAVIPAGAAEPTPRDAAARVDAAFVRALPKDAVLPTLASDEAFLRRAYLDLTGKLPDAEAVRQFVADTSADKRAKLLDQLLAGEAYTVNWSRYWRDVVSYHTPASGNYLRWQLYDQWWRDQVRNNRPWNDIVSALVTAVGVNDEQAPVNYLTSMFGNPVEIAATTSRVFLGVQIQCAECHDAKTEPWKREQFHEFAAFFGRAKIIQHKDVTGRGTPYAIEGRSEGQYLMTDKKDPGRRIAMQPRFLTGESVSLDADDAERRAALARFLTDPKNPWFARCYVNRIWTSLLGWGFYPSVIDLGAEQKSHYPEVLDALAKDFIASGHDMKWLFRTVMQTRAYQSQLQASASNSHGPSVCPARLRPEQVFENLQKALDFDENDKSIPSPSPTSAPAVQRHTGVRNMVYQAFKENPSTPAEQVQGTIPQALLLMNSSLVQQFTSANGKTILARLLTEKKSDEDIIAALYERVLARKPSEKEEEVCVRYIGTVGERKEALEDILWSLVNSTEFLLKK